MHRELIISAFAKAKNESLQETGREGSTTQASERISAYIVNVGKTPYSSKSLRNLYANALKPDSVVEVLQSKVLNALCNYIGYKEYRAYVDATTAPARIPVRRSKVAPTSAYLLLSHRVVLVNVGASTYLFSTQRGVDGVG